MMNLALEDGPISNYKARKTRDISFCQNTAFARTNMLTWAPTTLTTSNTTSFTNKVIATQFHRHNLSRISSKSSINGKLNTRQS